MRQRSCPFCGGTITSWQPSSWNHSSPACYQFHDFDYSEAFGAMVAKMHGTSYELVNAGQLRMLGIDSADEEASRLEAEHRRRTDSKPRHLLTGT
jgi:hypothetical protein